MNWVDLVWLVAVLIGAGSGLRGGSLSEILRLVGWGLIIEIILKYAPPLKLPAMVGLAVGLLVVAWVIRKLVCLVAGKPGLLSRLGGAVLGMARMAALMILLTLGVAGLHIEYWNRLVCGESRCGATVMKVFSSVPVTDQIQRTI